MVLCLSFSTSQAFITPLMLDGLFGKSVDVQALKQNMVDYGCANGLDYERFLKIMKDVN